MISLLEATADLISKHVTLFIAQLVKILERKQYSKEGE